MYKKKEKLKKIDDRTGRAPHKNPLHTEIDDIWIPPELRGLGIWNPNNKSGHLLNKEEEQNANDLD